MVQAPKDDGADRSTAEVDRMLSQADVTMTQTLLFWGVRVSIVAIVLTALNHFYGPFTWFWALLSAYAAVSLVSSLMLARLKRRQIAQLRQLSQRDR